MENSLITIVLPIYNVEKYLNRCIESIVTQTYTNLEIILVDDGSLDNSPVICDDWAKKDARIRVIHKQNEGAGIARNTGLEKASGEYICFFDSDDYIETNTIEKLYNAIKKHDCEAVIFGFNKQDKDGNITKIIPPGDRLFYSDEQVINEFLPDLIAPKFQSNQRFYMSIWLFMYSMEKIKKFNWKFVSERKLFSEDVYSLLQLFSYIKKVAVLPEPLYYYCENTASLSKSYIPDRYIKIKNFYLESIKLSKSLHYNPEIIDRLSKPFLGYVLAALKQEIICDIDYRKKKKSIKEIINDSVLQDVLKAHKSDKINLSKRIIYWSMRHKLYNLCIILTKIKSTK